ncbi:MAG: efflux RND transporter permease subunit [Robiginitomaculum sp.]
MRGIITWWAGNKVAANLLMLIFMLGGIISFSMMDREMDPYVEMPGAFVSVTWLGASPQDIEEQIVVRMEEAISGIKGLDALWSTSSESNGRVWAIAKSTVDKNTFLQEVERRVNSINTFPAATEPPYVKQFDNTNEILRIAVSGDVDERLLNRTAEKIRRDIAQIPSVPNVSLFGVRGEEVSIEVSETALKRYGLSIDDVARAVRATSVNASSGTVKTKLGDVQLRTRAQASNKADFENIIIRQLRDGSRVRVKDIATVIDGFEQVNLLATINGKPTVLVMVISGPDMNIVKMSEDVKKYMEKAKGELPPGISLLLWNDNTAEYKSRIGTIGWNFLTGLILVFITLIMFLRLRIALWVAGGIATAFLGGLALLPFFGVTFNMISTFAFLLVIGVIVDDAIIVGEAIHSKIEDGETGLSAAVNGTTMVVKPVIFAVLTTMIFFAPWMLVSGTTREFTRSISIVVILALTFSLLESLLILPAHLSHMKPVDPKNPFTRFQTRMADSLVWFAQKIYRPLMVLALRYRYITASIFIGLMVLSVGLMTTGIVKTSFMPESESGQVAITVDLPQGTPYSRTLEVLSQIQIAERALKEEINTSTDGEGKLIENWYTRARDNQVLAIVKLVPAETRTLSAKETADRLRALIGEIPDAETINVDYKNNEGDAPIEYLLNSTNTEVLNLAAEDLMAKLRSYEGVFNVGNDTQSSAEEVLFELKPGAEALGVTRSDVAKQVRNGFFGAEVQRLPRDGEDVRVYVRYPRSDRESLDFLSKVRIRTTDGREIPLSTVANLRFGKGVSQILRKERKRAIQVSAEIVPERVKEIRDDLKDNFFGDFDARYPEITRGAIGQSLEQKKFMKEIMVLGLIAILVAYFLIAISFRSYGEPLLILLAAIPFCFTGAMLGHLALGIPISIMSYLGIFAAAGVAVNDNLVLLDYVHKLRAPNDNEAGKEVGKEVGTTIDGAQALVEAGTKRFRPILLTSLTTFVGLLPLMLERSLQAQWLVPIGVSLAFGVLFAMFVTLFFVPALYGIGADVRRGFIRLLFKRKFAWFSAKL